MRPLTFLFALLTAASVGFAIEIAEPPANVQPGDDVDLAVSGLAFSDLEGANIEFFPKEKVRVKGVWNWGAGPEIEFRARLPGKYQIHVCATIDGKHEHDTIEIVVGEGDDPIPPPPPSLSQVVVVEEASDPLKYKYFPIIKDSAWRNHLRREKIPFNVVDQNLPDHQTVTPEIAVSIKAAQEAGLPSVVFLDDGNKVIEVFPLPSTPRGMLDLMKGGK